MSAPVALFLKGCVPTVSTSIVWSKLTLATRITPNPSLPPPSSGTSDHIGLPTVPLFIYKVLFSTSTSKAPPPTGYSANEHDTQLIHLTYQTILDPMIMSFIDSLLKLQ